LDLPSNRYAEIAPQVRDLFQRYGLTYTTGSLPRQVASAWRKVIRLSLPNDFLSRKPAAAQPVDAVDEPVMAAAA
jgi:fatty acid desaturase